MHVITGRGRGRLINHWDKFCWLCLINDITGQGCREAWQSLSTDLSSIFPTLVLVHSLHRTLYSTPHPFPHVLLSVVEEEILSGGVDHEKPCQAHHHWIIFDQLSFNRNWGFSGPNTPAIILSPVDHTCSLFLSVSLWPHSTYCQVSLPNSSWFCNLFLTMHGF